MVTLYIQESGLSQVLEGISLVVIKQAYHTRLRNVTEPKIMGDWERGARELARLFALFLLFLRLLFIAGGGDTAMV